MDIKMKKKIFFVGVMVAVALMAGCSTKQIYEGKYDSSQGWQDGYITDIGSGKEFIEDLPLECRYLDSATKAEKYATIKYWRMMNRSRHHTVPIPSDSQLKIKDTVYFNLTDCKTPVILNKKQ